MIQYLFLSLDIDDPAPDYARVCEAVFAHADVAECIRRADRLHTTSARVTRRSGASSWEFDIQTQSRGEEGQWLTRAKIFVAVGSRFSG